MLDDLHIEYKIKDQNRNLYWNKRDSTIEQFVIDINAFLHKKIQVPYQVSLVQTGMRHRRRVRNDRALRGGLRGKERYQFRGRP